MAPGIAVSAFVIRSCAFAALAALSTAQSLRVITVPWRGDPLQQHQVFSGGELVLQGIARIPSGCTIQSAVWTPGDGTVDIPVPGTLNPRALDVRHTYTGVNDQAYTARLTVTDSCGNSAHDDFRIIVQDRTLSVDVNMAIDKGLWSLHERQQVGMTGGVDSGSWISVRPESGGIELGYRAAATASAVLAMEVHAHLPSGDFDEDPYVDDTRRGLAFTLNEISQISTYGAEGTTHPEDYDDNGTQDPGTNSIGLQVEGVSSASSGTYGILPVYCGGQVIDALVATLTPNATASTGPSGIVLGRTYAAIVQDLIDGYSWGQSNPGSTDVGGWRYTWNTSADLHHSDNSAAQWWAISAIAAERVFGVSLPPHVKARNLTWLDTSRVASGAETGSYLYAPYYPQPDPATRINTTASGVVQLVADGVTSDDSRFDAAESYIVNRWTSLVGVNNRIYGMFAVAKSMRLALPAPVNLMAGTFDWYGFDPNGMTPATACTPSNLGLARQLVCRQQTDGSWDSPAWVADDLASAWAIVVLSDTIVQPPPVAVCDVDPETTGVGVTITCDGSASFSQLSGHSVVAWEWDFDGNGTSDATGPVVTTSYSAVGDYTIRLRVRDDSVPPLEGQTTCCVHIVPPPIPPNSNPGGPYHFCIGVNEPFVLDGSASSDADGMIVSYEWDFTPTPPLNFGDATGPIVDATAYFTAQGPGIYDIALRVTDNDTNTNTDFTTVQVFAAGDCPINVPPEFLPPSPCDQTLMISVGVPLDFDVVVHDANPADVITLIATGAPASAVFSPPLPVSGNPVSTHFSWTPMNSDIGTWVIQFTATDSAGHQTTCVVTLITAECYLLIGRGESSGSIVIGGQTFFSQILNVRSTHPVTIENNPAFPLSSVAAGTTFSAQVVMHNPQVYPSNPDQWSQRLQIQVGTSGQITGTLHGSINGIHLNYVAYTGADGIRRIRFPFTID